MKNLIKILAFTLLTLFSLKGKSQTTLSTIPKIQKQERSKHALGIFYNSTWVLMNEIGLSYEYQLNEKIAVHAGYGFMLIFYDQIYPHHRGRLGIKKHFGEKQLKDGFQSSFYQELEASLFLDVPWGAGMYRIGFQSQLDEEIFIQLALGGGVFVSFEPIDSLSDNNLIFAPLIDGYFKVAYRF